MRVIPIPFGVPLISLSAEEPPVMKLPPPSLAADLTLSQQERRR